MKDYKTENERLRAEVEEYQRRDRERDVAEAKAALAAREAHRQAEEEEARAEAAKAQAEAMEQQRRNAWLNWNVDQARARGIEHFQEFLSGDITKGIPAMGWPPGQTPESYVEPIVTGEPEPDSPLTDALRRAGMNI